MAQNTVEFKITADGSRARSEIRKTEQSIKGLKKPAKATATEIGLAGAAIVTTIGLITKSALDASIEFESAFAGVRKTIDATEEEYAELAAGIRAKALEIPVDTTELSKIAELGGQLGIAKENVIDFTDTIAKLAVTTNLTAEDAALSFARIANILQVPQKEIENMGSAVVDLGNNFATTESEIVQFANRIAGGGKIAGIAAGEIFGISTAFSSVGIQAEAGGSAVQKAFLKMNNAVAMGGGEVKAFSRISGLSSEEFKKLWEEDAAEAFTRFVEGLGKAGDQAANDLAATLGEDVRLQRAFLSLAGAGDLLRRSIEKGGEAFKENNALNKEAAQRFATTASKLILLKNRWNDFKISVGNGIKVILDKGINLLFPAIEFLVKAWNKLPAPVQKFLKIMSGAIVIIVSLVAGLAALKGMLALVGTGFGVIIASATPFIAVAAVIIGSLIALKTAWENNFLGIKTISQGLFSFLKTGFEVTSKVVKGISRVFLQVLEGDFAGAWENIKSGASTVFEGLKTTFINISKKVVESGSNIRKFTQDNWSAIVGIYEISFDSILTITRTFATDMVNNFKGIFIVLGKIAWAGVKLVGRALASIEWGKFLEIGKIAFISLAKIIGSSLLTSINVVGAFFKDLLANAWVGFKKVIELGSVFVDSLTESLSNIDILGIVQSIGIRMLKGFMNFFGKINSFFSQAIPNLLNFIKSKLTGEPIEFKLPTIDFEGLTETASKQGKTFAEKFSENAKDILGREEFSFAFTEAASAKGAENIAEIAKKASEDIGAVTKGGLVEDTGASAKFFSDIKKAVTESGIGFKNTRIEIAQTQNDLASYVNVHSKMTSSVITDNENLTESVNETTNNAINQYSELRNELRKVGETGAFQLPEAGAEIAADLVTGSGAVTPGQEVGAGEEAFANVNKTVDDTEKGFKETESAVSETKDTVKDFSNIYSEMTTTLIADNESLTENINTTVENAVTQFNRLIGVLERFRSVGFAIKATPSAPPPTITPTLNRNAPAHSNVSNNDNRTNTQNISVSVKGNIDNKRTANELANQLARKIQVEQLSTA